MNGNWSVFLSGGQAFDILVGSIFLNFGMNQNVMMKRNIPADGRGQLLWLYGCTVTD